MRKLLEVMMLMAFVMVMTGRRTGRVQAAVGGVEA